MDALQNKIRNAVLMRKIKKEIVIMTREELRESFAKEIEENMFEGSESVKEAEQKGSSTQNSRRIYSQLQCSD